MSSQTTETAFETYAEQILLTTGGWKRGSNAGWDKERALFPTQVFAFLQETQAQFWAEMKGLHATGLEALLLNTLVKELDIKGSLHVLRHGFKFYGKTFRLSYFKPAHGANPEVLELFGKNLLTVTRQVPCHPGDNRTLDMVLAVNGLPVATIELKNPGTGQNWRHAVRQY
jgi:type I restriction enzyme R subunit